ncbi:MAG: hypothetical protein ACOVOG_18830 [Rubrivivax sp.]
MHHARTRQHHRSAAVLLKATLAAALLSLAAPGWAKLPPPSDEAKAKAAEAAAKTAHGNKVADFKLCQSMDKVAGYYMATSKKAGKDVKPATPTPPCADPGAFVYPPPATAAAPAAAPTATAQATVAPPAAAKKP